MDYVWDYGALGSIEERLYIKSIVANSIDSADLVDLFTDLIAASQECIYLFCCLRASAENMEYAEFREVPKSSPYPPFFPSSPLTVVIYSSSRSARKCEHARRKEVYQTGTILQTTPYFSRVKQSTRQKRHSVQTQEGIIKKR